MYFHLKPLFVSSHKVVGHLWCSNRFTGRFQLFPRSHSFISLPRSSSSATHVSLSWNTFFLSLKLLAGQMLAHSRGRQRKVFHPRSWTTAECCDSCYGILNRSQSAVSDLGPAVFPQWSSVLAFLRWVSSPPKRAIVVCCLCHYTVHINWYHDFNLKFLLFIYLLDSQRF